MVAICLRSRLQSVTLKYMRRKFLCGLAAVLFAPVLAAQPVPARDLWEFPVGAVLEPAALAREAGSGLWNPATVAMPAGSRIRAGVAALSASIDAQLIGAAWRRPSGTTFGVSLARASLGGIVRTDTDPQGFGTVVYSSFLASATVARSLLPHVTLGLAARYRTGRADIESRSALAADVGVIVDSLPWHSARIALSSFLWRPGQERDDQPAFLAAADLRVFRSPTAPDFRLGYSRNAVYEGSTEHGPFASFQTGPLEVRAAYVNTRVYGHANSRARSGLALHFARYSVGIGREEGAGGLGPLYQFTLSSIVK